METFRNFRRDSDWVAAASADPGTTLSSFFMAFPPGVHLCSLLTRGARMRGPTSLHNRSGRFGSPGSDRFQIFDQVAFLLFGQVQTQMIVIMLDNIIERREPAIMIEAAFVDFIRVPQGPQRHRPVALVRRSHRLEIVDPDLLRCMYVAAGLR